MARWNEAQGEPVDGTFVFADLAGFTALTEAHGDTEAADLAERFCASVEELLPDTGAQAVKTIGDAVMLRVEDAATAVSVALEIAAEVGSQPGLPSVRIGMHTGAAVERDGDWFGAAVNTAARVSALARGGEVLLTDATRRAAGDRVEAVKFADHGRHELRNVAEPVLVYRAIHEGARVRSLPVDPVCRMAVDPSDAAGALTHDGTEHHFCSYECVRAFAADPDRYAGRRRTTAGADSLSARVTRALALGQGSSYVFFGLWSLVRRAHYRRVHELDADDWVLNAHGGWLTVVGATLVAGSLRPGAAVPELRALGFGSALALATNDALLRQDVAPVYRLDLAYEAAIATAWALVSGPRGRRAGRPA